MLALLGGVGFVATRQANAGTRSAQRPVGRIVVTPPSVASAQPAVPGAVTTMATALVQVPDVSGLSYDDAAQALNNVGLHVSSNTTVNADGAVLRQIPAAGVRLGPGATVRIVIGTSGPQHIQGGDAGELASGVATDTVIVPDLTGDTSQHAARALQALGLRMSSNTYIAGAGATGQVPESGTALPVGSTVRVLYGTP